MIVGVLMVELDWQFPKSFFPVCLLGGFFYFYISFTFILLRSVHFFSTVFILYLFYLFYRWLFFQGSFLLLSISSVVVFFFQLFLSFLLTFSPNAAVSQLLCCFFLVNNLFLSFLIFFSYWHLTFTYPPFLPVFVSSHYLLQMFYLSSIGQNTYLVLTNLK